MKANQKIFVWIMAAASATLTIQSCTMDEAGSITETDIVLAQDETYVNALFGDLENLVVEEMTALANNGYETSLLRSVQEDVCFTVTVDHPDSTNFPKLITIDFGDGCTFIVNGDTITRSGQIIITIDKPWCEEGAVHMVTFQNFYFNGVKIEGNQTMTNLGLNERNRLELGIALQNGKASFGENQWMTREATQVRAWARYQNPHNDTLFITGSANGYNILGETYQREITEPLVLVRCEQNQYRWTIAAGKVEISNSQRGKTTIDHSNSGCSGNVEVEKDGNQYRYKFQYNNPNNNNSDN